MALEDFKVSTDFKWDVASKNIYEDVTAKAGDINGRKMRVQVVDGTSVEDLTGYTLNLGWRNLNDPTKYGLDAFDVVDITKGIFEITYTSAMLTNIGRLVAALQLVGLDDVTESNNFFITVRESAIDAEAVQTESSFTALTEALVAVNGWNAEIDGKITAWGKEFDGAMAGWTGRMSVAEADYATKANNLESTYAPDLFSVKAQLEQTNADLLAGIGAVTADAEVVTARISTVKGKTFTVLDERLEEIENDAVILATNLVTNGDFSNGTTGWTTSSSVASIAANSDELTVNTTAQGNFGVFQNLVGAGIKYIAAEFFNAEGMTFVNLGNNGVVVSIPGNTWKRASTLYTGEGLMRFYGQAKESLTYKMRRPLIINLTATFGAGKEPTLAEMDRLMARFPNSWFDGVKPVQTIETLYQEKANKVQESWITPTLQNMWTEASGYKVRYMKDEFGFIHLKGRLTGGTLSAAAFSLPVGYRPLETLFYPLISSGAFGAGFINSSGAVTPSVGSNVNVQLDGITFRAEA